MTSKERVLAAFEFRTPDRIPRFDSFWDFPDDWRERLGDPAGLSDMDIWVPDEGAFPTRAHKVREEGDSIISVDTWGRTIRTQKGAYFSETLEVPIPWDTDPDTVEFDSPTLDCRYAQRDAQAFQNYIFGKTGGPFLRTGFVRGEEQFLMDIAGDPSLAKVLVDKMVEHLAAVGVEAIRRWNLGQTGAGMSIWDDMACNTGPMFSPKQFEEIFLPGYRRMIKAFKDAGAKFVFLHSDGNIMPILDMLVDAGIDGLNPLERRAGMDPAKIREKFPKLVLIGGMDNTGTLIDGPVDQIEAEAKELIDMGRDGGFIIGAHSISPEISLENFCAYDRFCRKYGDFSATSKT